jgi:nodulation protein E
MQPDVISAVGVISGLGLDHASFWDALRQGRSGIGTIRQNVGPHPDVGMNVVRFKNAACIQGYDPERYFDRKLITFMDPFAQFSLIAAREAAAMAGIEWDDELRESSAVVTGSCMGGRTADEAGYWELFHNGRSRVHPFTIPLEMSNAGTSHISMDFKIQGPAFNLSTACSSSTHAIGHAFWMVRSGAVPLAIAGGSEAPLFLGGLKAWEAMRVVSPDTCRPFSKDRNGMVLGEGAAMLILEPLERALARGAQPLAEITGFGMSADASHMTQPLPEGAARAIRGALRDARMAPEEVGYINAHGTATEANDCMEVAALRMVFAEHADRLPISSTKSMHGHVLGGAGAVEAVATVLALKHGILPPTANFNEPDPACDMDVIPNQAREIQAGAALTQNFAFGGLNAVLAFRAYS